MELANNGFLKFIFFCCRRTAAAVPETESSNRNVSTVSRKGRLHRASSSGLIAVCFRRGSRAELREGWVLHNLLFLFELFFSFFFSVQHAAHLFFLFFVSLFSPYYWIIKGITVHLVDCSTLPKVVDKLFDVEVSKFGPWYQTLGLRWKTSLGC